MTKFYSHERKHSKTYFYTLFRNFEVKKDNRLGCALKFKKMTVIYKYFNFYFRYRRKVLTRTLPVLITSR